MVWLLIIRFSLLLFISKISCLACDCFSKQHSYKCRLGSKTPYRFVAHYNDTPPHYAGCTERKIWMIFRHGTRYPSKKYITKMFKELSDLQNCILKNYKENKTNLSEHEISLLKEWRLNFAENDAMNLVKEGEDEMIDLGERYQSRFPNILPEIYSTKSYKFKYTATQRTEESAKHFAVGLFGWHGSKSVWYPEPEHEDPILRFYKRCPRWRKEVDKNPSALIEKEKFLQSEIFASTLDHISKRIGQSVDYEMARLIHMMCGFETAWNRSVDSPWCMFLLPYDFKVLEFIEDIEYYWIDGYGFPLTYEQSCPAVRDMFDFFISDEGPSATLYFTHSGTILKLLALLGIAKDAIPLTHDSFSKHEERAWRTGLIDAFASNIALVLYNCESQGPSILVMHQERPVFLSNCPKDMPCPLSIMKDMYPDREDECPFENMCQLLTNTK